MYKRAIRVIKRNKIVARAKIPVMNIEKAARIIRHERIDSVNNWITEHRENNRLEKIFSEANIHAWKTLSL